MLVLVILVPIAIMVLACSLERFEARAVPTSRPARTSRADLRVPATTPAEPLRLLPGRGEDKPEQPRTAQPEAPAAGLRRAS
jgi:hypothetical protein